MDDLPRRKKVHFGGTVCYALGECNQLVWHVSSEVGNIGVSC